jgi:c-di-GMP-binding flagellar brake protein YcgR
MEKRLYERISVPVKVRYEVKTRPKIVKESVTKNISGSGICLSLKEKLLPKTMLDINISIANNDDTLKLTGRIVWVRRIEVVTDELPAVYYDTGVELIDADPININRIITHFYGKSF